MRAARTLEIEAIRYDNIIAGPAFLRSTNPVSMYRGDPIVLLRPEQDNCQRISLLKKGNNLRNPSRQFKKKHNLCSVSWSYLRIFASTARAYEILVPVINYNHDVITIS